MDIVCTTLVIRSSSLLKLLKFQGEPLAIPA